MRAHLSTMPAARPVFCRAPFTKGRSSRTERVASDRGNFGNTTGTVVHTTMCFTLAGSAAILHAQSSACQSKARQCVERPGQPWLQSLSGGAGPSPRPYGACTQSLPMPAMHQGGGHVLCKEGLVGLWRQDAVHSALCSAVWAQHCHPGAQLAAPGVCARRPEHAIHAPGQLWHCLVLEQQVEAKADAVNTCAWVHCWLACNLAMCTLSPLRPTNHIPKPPL